MEQIRLAAEATARRKAEARRNRTRFNPEARVNERFWPSPHNIAVEHFGSLDGSANPPQTRPEGAPINATGHILDGLAANLGQGPLNTQAPPQSSEAPVENPAAQQTPVASNQPESIPSGQDTSIAAPMAQPDNAGALPRAPTPQFFSHQFSEEDLDSFLNDEPEGHVQNLDPANHPGIVAARRPREQSEEQSSKRARYEEPGTHSQAAVLEIQQRPLVEQADILLSSATSVSTIALCLNY